MFIFPVIYLTSFALAVKGIIKNNRQEVFLFLIFGLSIYNTALSISFTNGLYDLIGLLKGLKEIIIILLLGFQIYTLKRKVSFQITDYLVICYFIYTFLYALLPIGGQGIVERMSSFKNIAFFPMIYFCGRLFTIQSIFISKYFHFILYVAIAAACFTIFEFIINQHFQTFTGYADYQYYVYNLEPTGSYGLTYTFETDTGIKRFAGFFSGPLELAASTLIALAVIASLYTTDEDKIKISKFGVIALIATQVCIVLSLSRSAFLSYFLMIYVYAFLTKKKYLLHFIHSCFALGVIYFLFLLNNKDVQEFVISTINFTNSSSIGHLIEWVEGINSMISHPLGIGLGSSGILAGASGENIGGENEFIIIGVQAGVIACLLYLAIYIGILRQSLKWFPKLKGKERKLCLVVFLTKVGLFIPLFTSELELFLYISYITWFFSGLFISVISKKKSSFSSKLPDVN